jgi:hypothetical protein
MGVDMYDQVKVKFSLEVFDSFCEGSQTISKTFLVSGIGTTVADQIKSAVRGFSEEAARALVRQGVLVVDGD